MMRSPCCDAPVRVEREWLSLMGGEMWSETTCCTLCNQPCDPVDADAGEKEGEK